MPPLGYHAQGVALRVKDTKLRRRADVVGGVHVEVPFEYEGKLVAEVLLGAVL